MTGARGGARPRRRRHRPDHPEAVPEADRALRLRRVPLLRLDEGSRLRAAPARVRGRVRSSSPAATSPAAPRASTRAWALEDYGFRVDPGAELQRHLPLERRQDGPRAARAVRGRSSTRSRRRSPGATSSPSTWRRCEITHPDGLRIPIELDEYARETARPRPRRRRADDAARGADRRLRGGHDARVDTRAIAV